MSFTHLHLHTIYSFLDGLVKPDELMPKLKEMGMDSVAISDHGNMHGVVDFYLKAKDSKIKPVIGLEAYISASDRTKTIRNDAFHLLLLAENDEGYKNLSYLNSVAYIDGFYYKPRIDKNLLKDHHKGIIATSACLGGEVSRAIMNKEFDKAEKLAKEYKELFGTNENGEPCFFLEIQVNGLKDQEYANDKLIDLSHKLDIPLVATNDVHYLSPEAAEAQDILFCITAKTTVSDTENRLHHESNEFYLKSEKEMRELFSKYGTDGENAIDNTSKIAERCNVNIDLYNHYLPELDTGGISSGEYLREISVKGLKKRFEENDYPEEKWNEYYERLEYELEVIIQMGFPGYFLIVADYIQWAKDHDIPVGPGRGSGAGSLVAYSTGITDLDPLHFGLFFERFLNPERVSMPDFDVDFCQDNRDKVLDYVSKKYGEKNVAQIATFGSLKAKSSVKDVARALDIDLKTADKLTKIVPETFSDLLSPQFGKKTKDITKMVIDKYGIPSQVASDPDNFLKAISSLRLDPDDEENIKTLTAALKEYETERETIAATPEFQKIIKIAAQIEGLLRQPGKHACGIVIGNKPIYEYSPIFIDKDNYRVTQYDKNMVELVGLVKFDFLGLKTLTMLKHAETLIKEGENKSFDLSKIPLDDVKTYKFLCDKSTKGIFQMESGGFEKMIHQMKPDCIEDLIAAVALYRPGPMDIIPNYIRRKHGQEPIEYDHPWLSDILKETNGLIVYQEQVMQISQKMAGFTLGKADILRRAMGKKKAKDMEKMKIEFTAGAKEQGIEAETAKKVFDHMEKFASYGFNKSHAACYGYISYQTAFLKTHYPVEFFTALISSESGNAAKVLSYISDARNMGIAVKPPDINSSHYSFSVESGTIRYGFSAIKNVGEAAISEIMDEREKNGFYKSLVDFMSRSNPTKVNIRTVEYLIKAGAFDFTKINRGTLLSILPEAASLGESAYNDRINGQMSIFGMMGASKPAETKKDTELLNSETITINEFDIFESLEIEKEVLGVYLSDHPAALFRNEIKNMGFKKISEVIDTIEDKQNGYDRKQVEILGIVTTEIKPKKGRDGSYFLRGVIEDYDSAINFTINNIKENEDSELLNKLQSRLPLVFKIFIRARRNDFGELDEVSGTIKRNDNSVLTVMEYITQDSSGSKFKAEIKTTSSTYKDAISFFSNFNTKPLFEHTILPLSLKIDFPEESSMVEMKSTIPLTGENIKKLKKIFGRDNFYFTSA